MTKNDPSAPPCFVCQAAAGARLVEPHHDRVSGNDYRLWACPACGVVYADPHEPVGAEWYQSSMSGEMSVRPERDGRYAMFFADHLDDAPLLDIGCGQGDFLALARERGYRTTVGVDYDPKRVALARGRGLDAQAQDWESFCRSRAAGEFSIVTLFDVLEHVPDPVRLLAEVRRLLRPGGHLVITLLNDSRPMPFGRELPDYPPHHFTRWSPQAMRGLLERNGFAVQRQAAGELELRYLLEMAATRCAVEPGLRLAKRILFGGGQDVSASVTENFSRSRPSGGAAALLAGKSLRSALFASYTGLAKAVLAPVVLGLAWYYRLTRRDCGNNLYTLARKDGA
jgi:SAM-dependent methyltransferase